MDGALVTRSKVSMPPSFLGSSCIFPGCSVTVAALPVGFQGVFEAEKGPSNFLKLPIELHVWNAAIQHPYNMTCPPEPGLDAQAFRKATLLQHFKILTPYPVT